jgi:nucleoside-diphosphate-sugar epimerase
VLCLADRRPIAEIEAEHRPARPGAPVARVLGPPHACAVVDVTDPAQVERAAAGVDAVVNCTVVRDDPREAFRVNLLGAHAVALAARAHGLRRVVQTGPRQTALDDPAGYWYDFDLAADLPGRPGDQLYFLTKFLGQELLRVFADELGLEVPVLLFGDLVNPELPALDRLSPNANACSWADAARAVRRALHAPSLPHGYEPFHVVADLPHGKYRNDKAKRLLDWQPRDRLERYWRRDGIV